MGKCFSKPLSESQTYEKVPLLSEKDTAILQVKLQRDELQQKRELLYGQIEEEKKKALEFKRAGKTQQALSCLKKKKMLENQSQLVSISYDQVNKMLIDIEQAGMTAKMTNAMLAANVVMKKELDQITESDMEALRDLMDDNQEKVDAVNAILTSNVDSQLDEDAEEALNALVAADLERQLDSAQVPDGTIATTEPAHEEHYQAEKPKAYAAAMLAE
ncbi:putative Snf7 [Blattamonas nauphoetae]|uniref:Snf7 n=1 Tax=Blattamonas nauphoetae TaxID=2049346 RepID=A0ABQ9YAJ3_9EUKA|nr:putative Snf7 [Blattamonas nauphoetae]